MALKRDGVHVKILTGDNELVTRHVCAEVGLDVKKMVLGSELMFHAGEALFHTGWFVESLATQTLVLFVICTPKNPLKSRPSLPLALTTVAIVIVGSLLLYSPVARVLGFLPLPARFFLFLGVATLTYLALVEVAKRYLLAGARKRVHGAPDVLAKAAPSASRNACAAHVVACNSRRS